MYLVLIVQYYPSLNLAKFNTYHLCSNKTQENSHSRIFIMYLNVATTDLYQKIAQKLKS